MGAKGYLFWVLGILGIGGVGVAGEKLHRPIGWWLERVSTAPAIQLARLGVKEGEGARKKVVGELLPKLSLFSSVEHYSNPANLRPLPPAEGALIAQQGGGYPFSKDIRKIGGEFQFPLFVKELIELRKKVEAQLEGARLESRLKLIETQGVLVGLLSQYDYLLALSRALNRKETSLRETLRSVEVGVRNGQFPKFKELRLRDALHQVQLQQLELSQQLGEVLGKIEGVVGVVPAGEVPIGVSALPRKREFFPLKPVEAQLKVAEAGVKVAEGKYYPSIVVKGSGYRAYGRAYDNGKKLALNFGSVGIYLKWDLLDFSRRGELERSRVALLKGRAQLALKCQQLRGEERKLWAQLRSGEGMIRRGLEGLKLRRQLLADGKRGFQLGEVGIEDYLKYEDQVVEEEATIAKGRLLRNQALAGLGLLYGVDLRQIFK